MDKEMKNYLGAMSREEAIAGMEKFLQDHPELQEEEVPITQDSSFWGNIRDFWSTIAHIAGGPFRSIDTERRSVGKSMGRYVNTMRELSEQKPLDGGY